jgi:hypothetical protein
MLAAQRGLSAQTAGDSMAWFAAPDHLSAELKAFLDYPVRSAQASLAA